MQMNHECRSYYQGHVTEFALIDEFEFECNSQKAIRWYLKHSFLRKMINKAMRKEDTNQISLLPYFLVDLLENLRRERQQIMESTQEKELFYRQMKLATSELNEPKENIGKLIMMKEFFRVSDFRLSSSTTTATFTSQPERFSVLFIIECDIKELGDHIFC
ncbi:unnamed protein product [Rotaria socialis]|uniref:Uncharacterized protein n=2 Tax=Rotaria socialis TaxID=392032 RepID=A0A818FF38_9BILA|nr:unnamed protein product [Rotaria socialis]